MPTGSNDRKLHPAFRLIVQDKASMRAMWAPFLATGGVFIPSKIVPNIGENVFVVLTVQDVVINAPITGRVGWIQPEQIGSRVPGFVIQLGDDEHGRNAKAKIENLVAGMPTDAPVQTM